ncbi:MAG: hypothetical protein U1F51_12935 [Burkholderiales bacterium]
MRAPKIRCPSCRWEPGASSRWMCLPRCGTLWNTFATGGLCPGCGARWHRTQCLACGAVSPHRAWYVDPDDGDRGKASRDRALEGGRSR